MPKENRTGPGTGSAQRGTGNREQGAGFSLISGGNCICLTCGYRVAHRLGRPCNDINCPNCGRVMNHEQATVSNDLNL
ncbi:MAG: hypothetical protein PVG17_03760 [Desulfobacterales bacterium]|jgi:hypothetical protein